MNKALTPFAIRFGLIAAALSVGYSLIAYLVDLKLFANAWMGVLLWVTSVVLLILAVIQGKKSQGGFISFKDAFGTFMIAYFIYAGIGTIFTILLFNVIDTEAAERVKEITIEASVKMMETFNAPEEAIDEAIEKAEEQNQFSIGNQLKGFLYGIIFYSIIGLIVAAATKKNPVYSDDSLDNEV